MMIKQIKFVKNVQLRVILAKVIKIHALNVLIHRTENYLDLRVFAYQNIMTQEVRFVKGVLIIAWNAKIFQLHAHNVIKI